MGLMDKMLQKAKGSGLVEDDQEEQARVQQQQVQEYADGMWHWVRTTLDEACDLYQHEGDDSMLRDCLTGRALEDVRAFLDEMRRRNMVWTYPKERRNEFSVQVNDVVGDTYVITEFFRDHSQVERYQNGHLVETLEGDGMEKALRASVEVSGESAKISRFSVVSDPNGM